MQAHFSADILKSFRQEVCRSHPGLYRAKRMFNRLFSDQHAIWHGCHQLIHLIDLTKGFENVRTEMNLHVLVYNLKRMITIFGTRELIRAMQT